MCLYWTMQELVKNQKEKPYTVMTGEIGRVHITKQADHQCVILFAAVCNCPRPATADPSLVASGLSRKRSAHLNSSSPALPLFSSSSSSISLPFLLFTLKFYKDRENEGDKVIKSQDSFSRHCTSN